MLYRIADALCANSQIFSKTDNKYKKDLDEKNIISFSYHTHMSGVLS